MAGRGVPVAFDRRQHGRQGRGHAGRGGTVRRQPGQAFLNVGYDLLTDHERTGLSWWRRIQWLKGGDVNALAPDPTRAAVCKTGWAAYPTWAYHPYSQARALAAQARRHSAQRCTR